MSQDQDEEDVYRRMHKKFMQTATGTSGKFTRYKNIIDWALRGLGLNTLYEYPREFQILRDFFGLRCPHCNSGDEDCWDLTEDQMRAETLLEFDYDTKLTCPKCGYIVLRLPYDTLVLCAGMRSGKTVIGSIIASYVFHLTACFPNLAKKFNLIPGQVLRVSMVATASKQSEKTVWSDFQGLLKNAVDQDIRNLALKGKGIVEVDFNTKEWDINNIEFLSLHSNSGSLAGGTGAMVVLEEFSRFNMGDSARSADEVKTVLERSLATTRSLAANVLHDLFTLMVIVSSPWYPVNDPTLTLMYDDYIKEFQYGWRSRGKILGYHYPTWQFNPKISRDDAIITEAYRTDQYMAERDYGANPTSSENKFWEDYAIVEASFKPGLGFKFKQVLKDFGLSKLYTAELVATGDVFRKEYCVHIDLGETNNLLSMAFARVEDGLVHIDGVMILKPKGNVHCHIDAPIAIIEQLKDRVVFRHVSYDQWQSSSGIQKLGQMFILSGKRSVGEADLVGFKALVQGGTVTIVDNGDGAKDVILTEVKTQERKNGKITHADALISCAGAAMSAYYGYKQPKVDRNKPGNIDAYKAFKPVVGSIGKWR